MDIAVLNWLQQFSNEWLDTFFKVYTRLSDNGEIWIVLCLLFMCFKKTRKAGFLALCALALQAVLVMFVLKPMIARPRPFVSYGVPILIPEPGGYSFPSGHAAASFAVALMLYFKKVPFKKTIFFFASLMAYSRLYLYVHYPSDVIAGFFVALGSVLLILYYEEKITDGYHSVTKKFTK